MGKHTDLLGIFRAALQEIASSHYQQYGHGGSGMYGIGVSDGHRYCAEIASKALDTETPLIKEVEKQNSLLGVFVTAKLRGGISPRQGWVICADPLIIYGESGTLYECEGEPTVVVNPPND